MVDFSASHMNSSSYWNFNLYPLQRHISLVDGPKESLWKEIFLCSTERRTRREAGGWHYSNCYSRIPFWALVIERNKDAFIFCSCLGFLWLGWFFFVCLFYCCYCSLCHNWGDVTFSVLLNSIKHELLKAIVVCRLVGWLSIRHECAALNQFLYGQQ